MTQSAEHALDAEYRRYQKDCWNQGLSAIAFSDWLKQKIERLESEKKALFDECWQQHFLWMGMFIRETKYHADLRADDAWQLMTGEDRAANRRFLDVMHPIINPHLADK